MKIEPADEPAFELPADFAERVLREVDRRHARRRAQVGGAVLALPMLLVAALVALATAPGRGRAVRPAVVRRSDLSATDFAWLEQVGSEPGDPESVVFPDSLESDPGTEANPLVAVAENL
jgi:hypothetical protein